MGNMRPGGGGVGLNQTGGVRISKYRSYFLAMPYLDFSSRGGEDVHLYRTQGGWISKCRSHFLAMLHLGFLSRGGGGGVLTCTELGEVGFRIATPTS